MKTVLITGAAGGIGTRLRSLLKGVYPRLILSDREPAANRRIPEHREDPEAQQMISGESDGGTAHGTPLLPFQ